MSNKNTTRAALVAAFGGACQRCGYARCARALHFHHTDSTEKAEWSNGSGKASNAEIAAHPDRFLLLCANCHIEEHDRLDRAGGTYAICVTCGTEFRTAAYKLVGGRGKYCSKKCFHIPRAELSDATLPERFWKHVAKGAVCWEWTAYAVNGTGVMGVRRDNGKFSPRTVNRIAYELQHGPISDGTQVIHNCGNSLCVRGEHLQLGDHTDKMRQVMAHGNTTRGERSASAKLTEDQVREIRARYAAGGISQSKLGKEYGLCQANVGELLRRVTWHHLD